MTIQSTDCIACTFIEEVFMYYSKVIYLMREEYADLNICNFHLSRERQGGMAIMTIEIDSLPPDSLIADIRHLENVDNVLLIRRL